MKNDSSIVLKNDFYSFLLKNNLPDLTMWIHILIGSHIFIVLMKV